MTREEAIDIIRKNIPHLGIGAAEMTEALKELIPELRESEDERIRKEIIGVIQKHYPNTPESYRWISWLEKQKEPHYTKRNELFDKCVEKCDPAIMKEVSDKVDEMLGKEQKPSCWNSPVMTHEMVMDNPNPAWGEEDEK